jgi:outer membrane protein assembly factor BamB
MTGAASQPKQQDTFGPRPSNPQELWRIDEPATIIGTTDTAVFLSLTDRDEPMVARVAAFDGTVEWETTVPGMLEKGVAMGERLFAASGETQTIYSLTQESGEVEWEVGIEGQPPVIGATDEIVVVGSGADEYGAGESLRGVKPATGEEVFDSLWPIDPQSIRVKGEVVLSREERALRAYDLENGRKLWKNGLIHGPGAFARSYVAFPETGGIIKAFDPATGEELWANKRGWPTQNETTTTAAGPEAFAFNARVHEGRDYLYVFDATSGTKRWMNEHRAIHDVQIRGGTCVVAHDMLDIYDIESGQRRARLELPMEKPELFLTKHHLFIGSDPVVAYRV